MRGHILISFLLCSVACGDDDDDGAPPNSTPDAGVRADAATPVPSRVRLAHFSPDTPAIDTCFEAADGMVIGPVAADGGDSDGISFSEVTAYLTVDEGVYSILVVGGGATTCDSPVFTIANVVIPGGGFDITAVAGGFTTPGRSPAFELLALIDDNAPPSTGRAKLRFAHAAPGTGALDLGFLAGGQTMLAADAVTVSNVTYGAAGNPPYIEIEPVSGARLRAQLVGTPTTGIEAAQVDLPAGSVSTIFAIGTIDDRQIFVCDDVNEGGSCAAP